MTATIVNITSTQKYWYHESLWTVDFPLYSRGCLIMCSNHQPALCKDVEFGQLLMIQILELINRLGLGIVSLIICFNDMAADNFPIYFYNIAKEVKKYY